MKAAIYCRIIRPEETSKCTLSAYQSRLLALLEQEQFELFAIYVDEMCPDQENNSSLQRCLQDLKDGLFQFVLFI